MAKSSQEIRRNSILNKHRHTISNYLYGEVLKFKPGIEAFDDDSELSQEELSNFIHPNRKLITQYKYQPKS